MSSGSRIFNFSAGPSVLPEAVLKKAQAEMLDYGGTGESVMEMSHRSQEYKAIIEAAEQDLRDLMNIPDNYRVLFLQGGGTMQFAMVPINLLYKSKKADYVLTGHWAQKAYEEALKYGDIRVAASSEDGDFSYIPKIGRDGIRPDADYVHICMNNTIRGSHFPYIPDTGEIPLVADMSSCILSENIDVGRFGLIYAGAQKNVACAGLTIVIIREDLLGHAPAGCPIYLNYKIHADKASMYNTPPCYAIYIAGLVFKHIKELGGVEAMHERDVQKAGMLYDAIDNSGFYRAPVKGEDRSLMNVDFVIGDAELEKKFVTEAREQGMINLAGHRSVGGIRASLYNAMPMEGVEKLVSFMAEFQRANR